MNQANSPTIIVGAGFAGLFTALHLSNHNYPHPIILIDRNDRFCFKPLLYEYMSGEMESYQIVPLYVELLYGRSVSFLQDTVTSIDLEARQVYLADGTAREYSNLVLAPGNVPAFFAEGAAENTFTFQSKADVDALKQHLSECCQEAVQLPSFEERRSRLTVAIVGGGPAGVELALTLGDLLPQWYEAVDGSSQDIRIVLINRGDILQGDANSHLRDTAIKSMEGRRVPPELMLGVSVTAIRPGIIEFTKNGESGQLEAGTIVWTAGTAINPLIKALPVPGNQRTKRGHLLVKPTLQLLEYPDVFAAGDCAVIDPGNSDAKPLPATAQVAYQQGGAIAQCLTIKAQQKESLPLCKVSFRGTMMKLGLGTGVANLFDRYEIVGAVGQTIRQVLYLGLLPTPEHNIKTILDWIKDDVFHAHASQYHDIDYTADYKIEELKTLASAVTMSATAVSMAKEGVVSDVLKAATIRQELAGATVKYPTNRVINALFGHQTKRKMACDLVKNVPPKLEDLLAQAIPEIKQAITILTEKATPEELHQYKELTYSCCNRVARIGARPLIGDQMAPEEAAVLEKIQNALDFKDVKV
ncbi:MAG: NAD(P)/FAD-dependent oxidoreductase [Cyanobacteria bacterium J06592_8]